MPGWGRTAVASTTIASTTSASSTVSSTIALPYSASDFTDLAGWQHEWGSVNATNGTLSIGAATTTTGGEALLTNSAGWTDYLATIDFSWQKGETFSIIARYQPNRNNVSCEFMNNGETSVYETINGQRSLLGMGTAANFTPTQTTTVAWIRVKGDRVGCGLDNSIVNDYMYRGLSPVLLSGGLDLETWDPTPNNAQILVQDINVVSLQ